MAKRVIDMTAPKESFEKVYNEFRDCEFNKEFYGKRMEKYRGRLRAIDIFLALFAAGSGVAGFALWDYSIWGVDVGQIALGMFGGIAIVLGIAKPYLKWEDKLESLSQMHGSYSSLSHAHKDNVLRIKEKRDVDGDANIIYETLRKLRGMLLPHEENNPSADLKRQCQDKVNERYPVSFFFYPDNQPPRSDD